MRISLIIPTYNEACFIPKLIPHLRAMDTEGLLKEIIVVDAQSTDDTVLLAQGQGAKVLVASVKGRAQQMNLGAQQSSGEILHFVHADAFPPNGFTSDICKQVEQFQAGCFRSLFDTKNKFLRFNSYFTRFSGMIFRGGGQTLFITRQLFEALGGYNNMRLMEEYDLIVRIKQQTRFVVIQQSVLVSPRDYEKHGHFLLQAKYGCMLLLFLAKFPPKTIQKVHRWLLGRNATKTSSLPSA